LRANAGRHLADERDDAVASPGIMGAMMGDVAATRALAV
jgi:hypothetical protein